MAGPSDEEIIRRNRTTGRNVLPVTPSTRGEDMVAPDNIRELTAVRSGQPIPEVPTAIADTTVRAARPARATPSRGAARRAGPRGSSAETEALNDLSLARARLGINAFKKGGFVKAAPKTESIPVPGRQPGRPASGVKPLGTKPMVAAATSKTKPQAMPAFKKGGPVKGKSPFPPAKPGAAKGKFVPFGAKANPFAKKGK